MHCRYELSRAVWVHAYQQAIWATKGIPCMLLLLQAAPLSVGLALAGRSWCLCVEQEDVWFQGVCLSSPDADKEICCGPPGPACKAAPCVPQLLCVQEALFVCVGLSTCLSTCLSYCLSHCVCSHASLQRSIVWFKEGDGATLHLLDTWQHKLSPSTS